MTQMRWSQPDVGRLLSLRASGYSCAEVALMLGRTEAHVRSKLLAMGYSTRRLNQPPLNYVENGKTPEESPFFQKASDAVDKDLQRQQDKHRFELAKRIVLEDRVVSLLEDHWKKSPPIIEATRPSFPPQRTDKRNSSAVCLVGDLHMGKVVDPREVPLFGNYNPYISVSRLAYLEDQWIDALTRDPADELHIVLLGDMVDGHLGHIVQDNLTLPVAHQFDLALSALTQFVTRLSAHAQSTHLYGVTGNHGRMFGEKKMPASGRWNNFDGLLYRAIFSWIHAGGIENIHCHRTLESRIKIQVNQHAIQAMHGDEVRGGALAYNGINREYLHSVMRGYHTGDSPPDMVVMGDKHVSAQVPVGPGCCIINGSFVGVDAFGMGFPPSRPSQTMLRLGPGLQETQVVMLDQTPEDLRIPYQFPPELQTILNQYE